MKIFLKILGILISIFILILIGLEIQSIRMNSGKMTDQFAKGVLPDPIPNGFMKGSADFYTGSWQGKTFDFATHKGINNFGTGEKSKTNYPFETTVGKDINIPNLEVYQVDYQVPENPFWIRPLLDELVQIAPGHLLGKIQYRFIPGHPFTLGFFELEPALATGTKNITVRSDYFRLKLPSNWQIDFEDQKDLLLTELLANSPDFNGHNEQNDGGKQNVYFDAGAKLDILVEKGLLKSKETITETILESEEVKFDNVTTTLNHITEPNTKLGEMYDARFSYKGNSYVMRFVYNKEKFPTGKQFLLDTLSSFSFIQ